MAADFDAAVRSLLLPTTPGAVAQTESRIRKGLNTLAVPADDHGRWIKAEQRKWFDAGVPTSEFKSLIRMALYDPAKKTKSFAVPASTLHSDGMDNALSRLSQRYFDIHRKLVAEQLLENEVAHQLLSHTGSILRLRLLDRMSSSEIARWISAADARQPTSWKSIQIILQELRCDPKVHEVDAMSCFDDDTDTESEIFGDLTNPECIDYISNLASELGVHGNFGLWLSDLTGDDNHPPYVVILHYQLLIQNFYDHALSYLYEFTPRGQATLSLIEKYVEAGYLHVEGNPFLNNAKAVERADFNWVLAKKDNKAAVRALSGILLSLEGVGQAVKTELCVVIRKFLCRKLRLQRENGSPLLHKIKPFTGDTLSHLVQKAALGNSATTGILEQRLVEIWASSKHGDDWAVRGLGDSVFAANTFKQKFGDCEFEFPVRPNPKIVAYEAHGGKLTSHYVNDHVYTFGRVLEKRTGLMKSISALENWAAKVIFVAHEIDAALKKNRKYVVSDKQGAELELVVEYTTFADISADIIECGAEKVNDTFLRLNSHVVHPRIRRSINALSGL